MQEAGTRERRLGTGAKIVYGWGDHAVNLSLSSLSMLFLFFLTDVAGLAAGLAGTVILGARIFDAVSDPLVGRFSDTRRWRAGRRRPFFLIGMLPFALFFAALWRVPFDPAEGTLAPFLYYTFIYMGLSLATTTLSVPYLALMPEMARDYDERTSLNAFRAGAAVTGTLFAVGFRFLANDYWAGDVEAYAAASSVFAVWMLLPWLPVFRVSFENAPPDVEPRPLLAGALDLFRHKNFARLCGLFISARITVDLTAAALIYYATYWLERPGDFVFMMLILLLTSILSLPIWLRIAQRHDKHRLFIAGASWWALLCIALFFLQPDWPRELVFGAIVLVGFGYCAADLIPWAMIGEVIDEDELRTGQRREGIYNGLFTFLRKIAGASAVFAMGHAIEAAGYVPNQPQTESALLTIRVATALVPATFLGIAIAIAWGYPLTRAEHTRIRAELDARAAR